MQALQRIDRRRLGLEPEAREIRSAELGVDAGRKVRHGADSRAGLYNAVNVSRLARSALTVPAGELVE